MGSSTNHKLLRPHWLFRFIKIVDDTFNVFGESDELTMTSSRGGTMDPNSQIRMRQKPSMVNLPSSASTGHAMGARGPSEDIELRTPRAGAFGGV